LPRLFARSARSRGPRFKLCSPGQGSTSAASASPCAPRRFSRKPLEPRPPKGRKTGFIRFAIHYRGPRWGRSRAVNGRSATDNHGEPRASSVQLNTPFWPNTAGHGHPSIRSRTKEATGPLDVGTTGSDGTRVLQMLTTALVGISVKPRMFPSLSLNQALRRHPRGRTDTGPMNVGWAAGLAREPRPRRTSSPPGSSPAP
jgi:hypothetical protein